MAWSGTQLSATSFLTEQISSKNQQGFSITESRFCSSSSPLATDIIYIVLFSFYFRSISTRHQTRVSLVLSLTITMSSPLRTSPQPPTLDDEISALQSKSKFFPHSPVTTSLTSPSQNPQIRPRPPSLHPPHQPLHPRPPVIRPKTHLPILPPPIPSPPNPLPHLCNPHPLSRSGPRPQRRRRWLHPRSEDRGCFES